MFNNNFQDNIRRKVDMKKSKLERNIKNDNKMKGTGVSDICVIALISSYTICYLRLK